MWNQWNLVFRKTLGQAERTLVSELRVRFAQVPIEREISLAADVRSLFALYRLFRAERFDAVLTAEPVRVVDPAVAAVVRDRPQQAATAVPPARMGVYMGVFNLFIVIPQIVMSLIVPNIFNNVLGGDPRNAVVLGGISLLIAAASVVLVRDVV